MKLFHMEDGKEVVYVQLRDLQYLQKHGITMPASISARLSAGATTGLNYSRSFDCERFDGEPEVQFFKGLEFILDYDEYIGLSDWQMEVKEQKIVNRANPITYKWNAMSSEEQADNRDILQEYENLKYMLMDLFEIYDIKHGNKVMPFSAFVKQPPAKTPKKKPFNGKRKK